MKNSEQKDPKPKCNLKDIVKGKKMREHDTYTANGIEYWADRINIDTLATHADCVDCGVEFEKDYTSQRRCFNCETKKDKESFEKMPLVEWDGKTPLVVWGDEKYFFDEDSIEEYCEDHQIDKSQLRLELCSQTSFGEINIAEHFSDDLHEDWEPNAELAELEGKLNEYLKKASTDTWVGCGKRVQL